MQYTLSLQHITLSDTDEQLMNEKLDRLEKHLLPPFTSHVRFTRNTHHLKGDVVKCIVTINQGKEVFHAEREASNIQDALDEVISALNKNLGRAHSKRKDRHEHT